MGKNQFLFWSLLIGTPILLITSIVLAFFEPVIAVLLALFVVVYLGVSLFYGKKNHTQDAFTKFSFYLLVPAIIVLILVLYLVLNVIH